MNRSVLDINTNPLDDYDEDEGQMSQRLQRRNRSSREYCFDGTRSTTEHEQPCNYASDASSSYFEDVEWIPECYAGNGGGENQAGDNYDGLNDSLTLLSLQTTPRPRQQGVREARRRTRFIEIVPGLDLPLRGADESYRAIERGFYSATPCPVCNTMIACIEDADYVLCPDCRVVSPLEQHQQQQQQQQRRNKSVASSRRIRSETAPPHEGGVGLGLRFDYLS